MTAKLPLSGVKVLDLTTAAAGPWAAFLLGVLGADVLHIEPPRADIATSVPPRVRDMGVLYIACNMNKRSVSLDLTRPEDRSKCDQLLRSADVFIENMRPGAARKLGLDHDSLTAINPRIVSLSISGYGQAGPMSKEACTDPLAQAYCGWTSITGREGGRGEFLRYYAHIDLSTASFAVEAVLLALFERLRTGIGKHIDLSLVQSGIALQATRLAEYLATGQQPLPLGSAAAATAPNQAFRCEDGKWLVVSVETPGQWERLLGVLGDPALEAEKYSTNAKRVKHRRALARLLQGRFASRPARHWKLVLSGARIPVAPLLDFDQLLGHPQVTANTLLQEVETPWGRLWTAAPPWRFSRHTLQLTPPPVPGSGEARWCR